MHQPFRAMNTSCTTWYFRFINWITNIELYTIIRHTFKYKQCLYWLMFWVQQDICLERTGSPKILSEHLFREPSLNFGQCYN